MEVRIYQNEEAVRCSLQAKRESPYRLLIDESVPTAILFLLDAAHCTSREFLATVFVLLQCAKSRSSIRSEAGGTLKLESVLGRQKPHFSDDIEKQSIM